MPGSVSLTAPQAHSLRTALTVGAARPAPGRERFELAHLAPPAAADGGEPDGETGGAAAAAAAERYRFSRCRRALPAAVMQKLGVPLPAGEREVLQDDLAWEDIQVGGRGGRQVSQSAGGQRGARSERRRCECTATWGGVLVTYGLVWFGWHAPRLPSRCPPLPNPAVGPQRRERARPAVPAGAHPLHAADWQARRGRACPGGSSAVSGPSLPAGRPALS